MASLNAGLVVHVAAGEVLHGLLHLLFADGTDISLSHGEVIIKVLGLGLVSLIFIVTLPSSLIQGCSAGLFLFALSRCLDLDLINSSSISSGHIHLSKPSLVTRILRTMMLRGRTEASITQR